jgi:hypothetical protein
MTTNDLVSRGSASTSIDQNGKLSPSVIHAQVAYLQWCVHAAMCCRTYRESTRTSRLASSRVAGLISYLMAPPVSSRWSNTCRCPMREEERMKLSFTRRGLGTSPKQEEVENRPILSCNSAEVRCTVS